MSVTERIIFKYDGEDYTVPKATNPIILPCGEVLKATDWCNDSTPPNPGKFTLLFRIQCVSMGLKAIADSLNGVLAVKIKIKKVVTCPTGCHKPTSPFCKNCGAKVDVSYEIEPASKLDKI